MSESAIDSHDLFISSLMGKPLPKHPKFGPFGNSKHLVKALELLSPLHDLKSGTALPLGDWKNPLMWTQQGMRGRLWTIAQRINEAIALEHQVGPWNSKYRKGGWRLHADRCSEVRSAATDLLGALDRLQNWEKAALAMGAMLPPFSSSSKGLDVFVQQLGWVLKVAEHMETETETGQGNPYVFMHGPLSLRLAVDLVNLWNGHPDGRKAKDSRTTEGPMFQFVSTIASFALPVGKEIPTTDAVRDAIRIVKNGDPQPYPLYGTSPYFGFDWGEAYIPKKRRAQVLKNSSTSSP